MASTCSSTSPSSTDQHHLIRKRAISELDKGRNYAEQLLGQLQFRRHSLASGKPDEAVELVTEVMRCFSSAIAVLMEPFGGWSAYQKPSEIQKGTSRASLINGKRKKPPVKDNSRRNTKGSETREMIKSDGYAIHDNYSWRKYGAKHINGYDFPREYFKCSYEGCLATKRVQKIQDGSPGLCLVTCQNEHSCIIDDTSKEKFHDQNKCYQRAVKEEHDVLVDHFSSVPFEAQQLAHVSPTIGGMQTWTDHGVNFGHGFQPSARGQLDFMLINDYNPEFEEAISVFLNPNDLENGGCLLA